MVYRIYTEKMPGFGHETATLYSDIVTFLGIGGLTRVRILNRYDVEGIGRDLFTYAENKVFSEPQVDYTYDELRFDDGDIAFAVEYLPGQYDQRADSAAQCIQLISKGERPTVKTARVYILSGKLSPDDIAAIKRHVINPVEAREASLDRVETLAADYTVPGDVATLDGFTALDDTGLSAFISSRGLAMDLDDIRFCRDYFRTEGREPTITEIKMIDTYWSDHCRHTTFNTIIDNFDIKDPEIARAYETYLELRRTLGREHKNICLMDIATVGAKYLKHTNALCDLDESDEINACTVKIKINVDGHPEDWLLLFKNETHNHPTEIEPFGGAATCIGGAIRDPLSGRAYVYAAMRVTGAADPTRNIDTTLPGKLPQRKLVTTAAAGYSSYGNQIGLATGQVSEIYHPGYVAKRMEIGAVLGAAPAANVKRLTPAPGDIVILLGGRTGRDGIGGATGSSKSHTEKSLSACGAEVQKGNAPEERKLQRLFRNPEAASLIKRCNDFGAGGVSVAVGELADGLMINLDAVPKKYDGLDGTELAISESQERMAVVVAKSDAARFFEIADTENLEATEIAVVTEEPRLTMLWRGSKIVDIKRGFLDSNGAEKHINVEIDAPQSSGVVCDIAYNGVNAESGFAGVCRSLASDLNVTSGRGLSERFDSTIGRGTVLMPFGGKYQLTPSLAMVNKLPVPYGSDTDDCSFMAWGYNPTITEKSPYHGAYLSVIESAAKLIASGAPSDKAWLTFQEYFEKPMRSPSRWGKPAAALLGALKAQLDLGFAAIGGKDSMSGTFEHIDVPPTLVSFAVSKGSATRAVSPEFKHAGERVVWLRPDYGDSGLPEINSYKACSAECERLISAGADAVATPSYGGALAAIIKMTAGNAIGIKLGDAVTVNELLRSYYGSFIIELTGGIEVNPGNYHITTLGITGGDAISYIDETIPLDELMSAYTGKLESVYPTKAAYESGDNTIPDISYNAPKILTSSEKFARPRVLIPVFPGTNCEYDTADAVMRAGGIPDIFVINNKSSDKITASASEFARRAAKSQIIIIPGGFSGGDEPDGSGKFITAFLRGEQITDEIRKLLFYRDGLMCGICNGFQALIKLGLVPYGDIVDTTPDSPTLTYNIIGRHQSRLVKTRIASNKSPWLSSFGVGDIHTVPISHGEGRFIASEQMLDNLILNGQIATQYVDENGSPTYNIDYNPNGSVFAVEGITSPDGRVFGRMGHSERTGRNLYKNVPGDYDCGIFENAVKYFK